MAAVKTVTQIHEKYEAGDILVFLTGQEEIEKAVELLTYYIRQMGSKIKELIVHPIYSALSSEQQARIFLPPPPGARKVIVATNIAETSITIDGIAYVVDAGFGKQKSYNPRNGMEALVITPISKASAKQRAGRAGRVGPGKCFRLYTAWAYENELEDANIPEIQRSNVSHIILLLKTLGISDPFTFDFMNAPPAETMLRSTKSLIEIGALDEFNGITRVGRCMSEIPVDPMLARSIIAGCELGCPSEITAIAAILSSQGTPFVRPPDKRKQADEAHKRFWCPEGDHMTVLRIFEQVLNVVAFYYFLVVSIRLLRAVVLQQLYSCTNYETRSGDTEPIGGHARKTRLPGASRSSGTGLGGDKGADKHLLFVRRYQRDTRTTWQPYPRMGTATICRGRIPKRSTSIRAA